MKDLLEFLDHIEGHGYGGMASFEIARSEAKVAHEALVAHQAHERYEPTPWGHECTWCPDCIIRMGNLRRAALGIPLTESDGLTDSGHDRTEA